MRTSGRSKRRKAKVISDEAIRKSNAVVKAEKRGKIGVGERGGKRKTRGEICERL